MYDIDKVMWWKNKYSYTEFFYLHLHNATVTDQKISLCFILDINILWMAGRKLEQEHINTVVYMKKDYGKIQGNVQVSQLLNLGEDFSKATESFMTGSFLFWEFKLATTVMKMPEDNACFYRWATHTGFVLANLSDQRTFQSTRWKYLARETSVGAST